MAAAESEGSEPRDNREAILAAVTRVIARRGVRGLRVEDVASEAGVSPPLLYYHFENRAGLVRAALERAAEQAPSAALRGARTGSGLSAVCAALESELSERTEVRENAVVWGEVSATAVFEEGLREDVKRVNEAWRADVSDAIGAGIADGSIRRDIDPDAAAELLIALVDGLCARWLAGTIGRSRAIELLGAALGRTLAPT